MELTLNGQAVVVRDYQEDDYVDILRLNIDEKWNNLVENVENVKQFWNHSSIPNVVMSEVKFVTCGVTI
ncbi:MAG: hypothetical protein ACQEWF_18670 [Bacillota bacterium]